MITATVNGEVIHLTGFGDTVLISDDEEGFEPYLGKAFDEVTVDVDGEDGPALSLSGVVFSDEVYEFEGGYYVVFTRETSEQRELRELRADLDFLMLSSGAGPDVDEEAEGSIYSEEEHPNGDV